MEKLTEEQEKAVKYCFRRSDSKKEFKEMLEVAGLIYETKDLNKWYRSTDECGFLVFLTRKRNTKEIEYYGFSEEVWTDNDWLHEGYLRDDMTEATDEEVEEALIVEAKKRYNVHDKLKYFKGNSREQVINKMYEFIYRPCDNELLIRGASNSRCALVIFKEGKWAEVINDNEMTIEELEKLTGIKN